ncbi:FG-GAP repeat domain-containing protein [Paraliomyxa miuraensis]|uniref:FG-GAP repeat domain-containing protein n=1 Tax=Paraliomyxa miuraensis TaxID=376150 RepID=UPI00224D49C9|nr:VCBS repeat-containing protein [Paraliomyxa miuraensis]MCX4243453.1 VCBS repeat-containing protein [Paraliomyxa miuraensis]
MASALANAALLLLTPSTASATPLPGWGIDGNPNVDEQWCHGTNRSLHVGDFDGDGAADLLCHNRSTGRKRIDFANQRPGSPATEIDFLGFWGTDWDHTDGWCTASGETLLVGDYNGDGRDDLLCHVKGGFANPGRKRIDFADGFGKFWGTNFDSQDHPTAAQTWCTHAGEKILVGDFNGDGKDDLLCFVQGGYADEGRKRIDFANPSGTFFGTEFNTEDHPTADQTWCTDDGELLHVGDFDGDGRDDLLCHVKGPYAHSGRRRVDLANNEGTFFGANWSSTYDGQAVASWCGSPSGQVKVGDVDADGRDDLMCMMWDYGGINVDHASASGAFHGTDGDMHAEYWCETYQQFYSGDFDGDGDADALCHDTLYGDRSVRYANDAGDFFSVCSDGSFQGDGTLGVIPIHFVVATNPNDPNISPARDRLPTSTSSHINPLVPGIISQTADPSEYFRVEVDVMNERTYDQALDPVCDGGDCMLYEYESHVFYDEIANTSCDKVREYANPTSIWYTAHCDDDAVTLGLDPAGCFPNSCGKTTFNDAMACEFRECDDPRINKPGTVTIVIADLCDWDMMANDVTRASCDAMKGSFASRSTNSWGEDGFDAVFDYWRMMRGPNTLDIQQAQGVEQHELGHIFGLDHHDKCIEPDNPMHRNYGACGTFDPSTYRLGGYSTWTQIAEDATDTSKWYGWVNQIDTMIDTARDYEATSCN